ncbi:MAG: hypothetical protein AAF235_02835 [Planctomycetota bacterium]
MPSRQFTQKPSVREPNLDPKFRRRSGYRLGPVIPACCIAGGLMLLAGCASSESTPRSETMNESRAGAPQRLAAMDRLWEAAKAGAEPVESVRIELKDVAWNRDELEPLRLRAVRYLLEDTSPAGTADNRGVARLMLPTEPARSIVAEFSRAAAENGWTECTDALVRRLAVDDAGLAENDRIETVAIRSLHPGRTVDDVLYEQFIRPTEPAGFPVSLDWRGRTRAAAWRSLARRDATGTARPAILSRPLPGDVDDDTRATVAALRVAASDLGVQPETAMEFEWLRSLRDGSDANEVWWRESAAAVASARGRFTGALSLRHVEPIRWARQNRPEWLSAGRSTLLDELESRQDARDLVFRTFEFAVTRGRSQERVSDWRGTLTWQDALAMLVVDEALRSPEVRSAMSSYTIADRRDKDTEYGGVIDAGGVDGAFRAVLYPPRQRDRKGDRQFVASADMFAASDRALAHFHLQVLRDKNSDFAGPSSGDLGYVERSGRTGVVLTSVRNDALNADVYQPGGETVDLGTIEITPYER